MRIIGVDAPRGFAILDASPIGKARLVALGTLDQGRECDELAELVDRYEIEAVGIEAPLEPYIGGRAADGGPGVRRAILISLLAVARLAGRLEDRAITLGRRVSVADAKTVRKAFRIRGKDETELDRAVKAHVMACVAGWPAVSNVDERDAAAMALYAAL